MTNRFRWMHHAGAVIAAACLLAVPRRAIAEDSLPFGMTAPALQVGLVVGNGDASADYYEKVIGFKRLPGSLPLPGGGRMLRLQHGPTTIKLLEFKEEKPKNPGGVQAAIGIRLMSFIVTDIDEVAKRSEAANGKKAGVVGPKGKRMLFLSDPDGNQLEIFDVPDEGGPEAADRFWIGLTVGDSDASRKFYGDVLGLNFIGETKLFGATGPPKFLFKAGQTTIKFWKLDKDIPKQTGPFDEMLGLRYFTFLVPDVDAVYEQLKAKGASIPRPPADFGGLARVMFVEDPDANWIEFAQVGGRKPKTP